MKKLLLICTLFSISNVHADRFEGRSRFRGYSEGELEDRFRHDERLFESEQASLRRSEERRAREQREREDMAHRADIRDRSAWRRSHQRLDKRPLIEMERQWLGDGDYKVLFNRDSTVAEDMRVRNAVAFWDRYSHKRFGSYVDLLDSIQTILDGLWLDIVQETAPKEQDLMVVAYIHALLNERGDKVYKMLEDCSRLIGVGLYLKGYKTYKPDWMLKVLKEKVREVQNWSRDYDGLRGPLLDALKSAISKEQSTTLPAESSRWGFFSRWRRR